MATDSTEARYSEPMGALSALAASQEDFRVREFDHDMIADALAMRQLRDALDAFASQHGDGRGPDAKIPLERLNVITLLTQLQVGLTHRLMGPAYLPSDDEDAPEVILEHPAISLLQDFISALYDLENAKTNEVVKPSKQPRGSPLWRSEVRRRHALFELVDVIKIDQNMRNRALAERKLEDWLIRTLGRAKATNAKQLVEMRKTRNKQRLRAQK